MSNVTDVSDLPMQFMSMPDRLTKIGILSVVQYHLDLVRYAADGIPRCQEIDVAGRNTQIAANNVIMALAVDQSRASYEDRLVRFRTEFSSLQNAWVQKDALMPDTTKRMYKRDCNAISSAIQTIKTFLEQL